MFDIQKFYKAASVSDAIEALNADRNAAVICGGTDVLINVRSGKMAGRSLVSIHDIGELKGVSMNAHGVIVIRPATVFSHITKSTIVRQHIPMLGEAVDQVGGPQIRNVGTIGGNVCNGAVSADSASSLFAMNALLELTSSAGIRRIPIQDFYKGPGKVDLAHSELLTSILITPDNYAGFSGHYIKYAQRGAMDIATLGCAAYVKLSEDKTKIAELRLAFGVAAPTPIRCPKCEELANGAVITADLFEKLGETATTEISPRTSWRASKEFRIRLVRELSQRAVRQAIINGGGSADA